MQHLRSWAGGHLSRRICLHLPAGRSPGSLLSSFTLLEQNPDSLKASRALCVLHYCHDAPRRASHLPQVDAHLQIWTRQIILVQRKDPCFRHEAASGLERHVSRQNKSLHWGSFGKKNIRVGKSLQRMQLWL